MAFRDDPDLKNVEQFYQEFKQRGLEFPPAEPDSIVKAAVPATVRTSQSIPDVLYSFCYARNREPSNGNRLIHDRW